MKNKLVPKHDIIGEREKEELLAKYGISLKHLPRISVTDSVVKAIGAKLGDVVKIVREDQHLGKTIYYRVVVKR